MEPTEVPPTRIYLVRHGEAEGADGVAVGQVDLPLSAAGAESIRRLAGSWPGPPPDRLVASDLARATASAEILNERWSLGVETDARLREMDFGAWDGSPWTEIRSSNRELFDQWMSCWWHRPAPGGESLREVADRACAWLDDALAVAGRTVVAVAHGGTIRTALCQILGLSLERAFHLHLDHGFVSGLVTTFRGVEVELVNADRFPAEREPPTPQSSASAAAPTRARRASPALRR